MPTGPTSRRRGAGRGERVFDNVADPGFWNDADPAIETIDPLDPAAVLSGPYRDPDEQRAERQPGDRAAPRHTGSVTSRFEFVAAVVPTGAPAPTLQFPTCTETEAIPYFGWQPADPIEGQVVEFIDLSSYGDGGLGAVWRFDDPTGVSPTDNTHRFSDNGTYAVDFTVTDAAAVGHTSDPADVVVKNAPPVLDALSVSDTGRSISFQVDDPGRIDRQQLEVRLTSPTPGWPSGGITQYTAPPVDPTTGLPMSGAWGDTIFLPNDLTPGVYFVVLTVLDKDGGTATRSFSLAVPVRIVTPFGFAAPSLREAAPSLLQRTGLVAQAVVDPSANSPLPAEPVPAFVIDRRTVGTGEVVEIRNATRTGGEPAGAWFDPGDGRPPSALAAGASVGLTYGAPGTPTPGVSGLTGAHAGRRPDWRSPEPPCRPPSSMPG